MINDKYLKLPTQQEPTGIMTPKVEKMMMERVASDSKALDHTNAEKTQFEILGK